MSGERVLSRVELDSYPVEKAYLVKSAKDTAQPPIGEAQEPLRLRRIWKWSDGSEILWSAVGRWSDLVSQGLYSDLGGGGRFRFLR